MTGTRYIRNTPLLAAAIALAAPLVLSGCLLGPGAAAGAAVGGCAILDENEDDIVSEAEFSEGLFSAWDDDENNSLDQDEFSAGVASDDRYDDWSDDFDDWDENDDDVLSQVEFSSGAAGDAIAADWLDDECDDLGL